MSWEFPKSCAETDTESWSPIPGTSRPATLLDDPRCGVPRWARYRTAGISAIDHGVRSTGSTDEQRSGVSRWDTGQSLAPANFRQFGFFQSVLHLNDWLAKDPATHLTSGILDKEIDNSLWLRLCADLANGHKHMVLDQRTRTGEANTRMSKNGVTINAPAMGAVVSVGPPIQIRHLPSKAGTVQHNLVVESNGHEYEVIDIARNAVADWRSFLEQHGYL